MAITTKNRKDLKSNFVKNAIPTEQNFADLVDAQLNQAEDGVFKLAGEPFSVVSAGGGQKRVLRLYADYPAANPDWLISLNPAQNPADAATNRAGFGIADGAGNTRLFLDASGKLGLGTNEPQGNLDVRLPGGTGSWNRFVVNTTNQWGDPGAQYVTIGAGGAAGIMANNLHVPWIANESRASIRYGLTGGTAGNTYWDVGLRSDGSFGFIAANNGGAGQQVVISKAGLLTASAGLRFDGVVAHLDVDGALYRNTDGQVYLTVDDNFYFRDSGSGTGWALHVDANAGTLNLKGHVNAIGGVNAGALSRVSANGGMFDIVGVDHGYIQFYPQKLAGGRKGWVGYGSPNGNTMGVTNEAGDLALYASANMSLNAAGGQVVALGGVVVNDGSNTGVRRGLWLWSPGDSNHVIYSAGPQGKTPANTTPPTGPLNGSHRMRFRTASGQGFLFENNADQVVVDIDSSDGDLWTRGRATLGGGLTVPTGQPIAGVPIIVTRSININRNNGNWSQLRNSRWQWDWTEYFDANVSAANVVLTNYYLEWNRDAGLKTIEVYPWIISVSGTAVRVGARLGWRDFSGDWDDVLDPVTNMTILLIVQMSSAR